MDALRGGVMPAGLDRSIPREVVLTSAGRVQFTMGIILFVAAAVSVVLLSWKAASDAAWRAEVAERAVDVEGQVTGIGRSNDDDRRRVTYRYEADGRTLEGDASLPNRRIRGLSIGASIPVRYVPGHPTRPIVDGRDPGGLPLAVPFIVGASLIAGGACCLAGIQRQRRLLSEGRAATGTVTGVRKHHHPHGGTNREITYEFPVMSGARRRGKAAAPTKNPPPVGTPITVVYDPDNPRRSRQYPLSLVRLAVEPPARRPRRRS